MKAEQLRIGNIVKSLNTTVDYCFIEEIRNGRIKGIRRTFEGHTISVWNNGSDQLLPISLTEDWLLKFGFTNSRIVLRGDSELEIRLDGETFHIWPADGQTESHNYRNHINYVHQLQNLYFDLTVEELTITGPAA